MMTIVADELVHDWNRLLAGVQQGRTYLIQYKGQNLALLGPCPGSAPTPVRTDQRPTFRDETVADTLGTLARLLGTALTAQLLGLPVDALVRAGTTGLLNTTGRARLAYLKTLCGRLSESSTPKTVRLWMTTPQNTLRGRSPVAALGGLWHPDVPNARQLLILAEKNRSSHV